MHSKEIVTALERLKNNPDFKIFGTFLDGLELRAMQALHSSKDVQSLPVLQGRVQTFIAIKEEIHNVTRKNS